MKMNILIITAHPSTQGFTHKIAAHYKKGAEKNGHKVEVLDLYNPQWKQGFLEFENIREMPPVKHQKEVQEKISWANELALVFPMWWFGTPAIMKNFFEQNFTPGFAYKYEKTGKRAKLQRLLKGKTARIFITADGPSWLYRLIMTPAIGLRWGTLFFCGIWTKSWTIFGRMRFTDEADREKRLKKVEEMARRR